MYSLTYVEVDVPSWVPGSPDFEDMTTFRFAVPTDYLPTTIYAIPSILDVSYTAAKISLGKDLGQRASIKVSFKDHLHVFNGEPYDQGTFFGKWRGRYGVKLRGCALRLIRGQLGDHLEDMETRHFAIDMTEGPSPDGVYTIEAKDLLKFADQDRAQAPLVSNGRLAGSINSSTTSATMSPTGIGNEEYPSSGWISIGGKEVVAFTRVNDALTITRSQFGSVATGHDAGDRLQIVLRYDGDDVADIISDLLINYAGIPADTISLAEWQAETSANLGVIYARTITEPTSVNKLVSELIEQAALAVWWDDRAQQVRLVVLREIATDTDTFDEDRIIEGSLRVSEQHNKRVSQIWTFYGERDPTDRGADEDNYRAALADVDLTKELEYGSAEIRKIQASWVETETAASRLNTLQLSRFRDPPRQFSFSLVAGESVTPGAGYTLEWWGNQNELGERVPALIQITSVEVYPDRIQVQAEEMLASGEVVLVNVVFLTSTATTPTWEVDASWNNADNSVHTVGGGGAGGGNASVPSCGGGGGGWSRKDNITLTPGAFVTYQVGAGGAQPTGFGTGQSGGDTWFNGANFAASSVGAKGGGGGASNTPGTGGQASAGIGDAKFSGGSGGARRFPTSGNSGGSGGGGAAGPNGNGGDGGRSNVSGAQGGAGGGGADGGSAGADGDSDFPGAGGTNRFNFGGGAGGGGVGDEGGGGGGGGELQNGGAGGAGEQIWTQTVTPITSAGPGGGGGAGGNESNGAAGGLYGGGGGAGGNSGFGAAGAQGIIVIIWREA